MRLDDVKIDGSTAYHCSKNGKDCVIEATFAYDGATLIARDDEDDDHFLDLWVTEACYLMPIEGK